MKGKKIISVRVYWWKLSGADKDYESTDNGVNTLVNVQENKNAIKWVRNQVKRLTNASFAVRVEYTYEGDNHE